MMLLGHHVVAKGGTRGLDANQPLRTLLVQQMLAAGFLFVIRYIRQDARHTYDLSEDEAGLILDAGMGLMIVQHVPAPGWLPNADSGTGRGQIAVKEVEAVGLPPGAMIWMDLEGVKAGVPQQTTVDYCNHWHKAVASAGYLPGLYVGFQPGISAHSLYYDLRFTHYWGAYNVDIAPAVRGFQMRQLPAPNPKPISIDYDVDVITEDRLGGLPLIFAPEHWA